MKHMIKQFLTHLAYCFPLQIGLYFLLKFLHNNNPDLKLWIPDDPNQMLTWSGLLVAALLPIRELFDLHYKNNTFKKGLFDIASWWVGVTIVTIALHYYIGG